ncbi:MAG: hypothetical protein IPK59_19990 [Rhodospirillaceae bacterium]|nr:hypothetical protein [Rhodospirillaceae bacterium]
MTLEGVLGPNSRVDEAPGLAVAAPAVLAVTRDEQLLFSSGNSLHALKKWGASPRLWRTFDSPVTALCCSPGGLVAVGCADGAVLVLDQAGDVSSSWSLSLAPGHAADCLFLSETELAVVDTGYKPDEAPLSLAPWDATPRGQVSVVRPVGRVNVLASGLHCPMGISQDDEGNVLVTELELARIVETTGRPRQSGYPAYPGRLRRTNSGYVMACLARRDPLIEFLKTEPAFVAEMTATIDPRNWISPRLKPDFSHDFPIELGATRLFGEVKPWAPSFSYGLVIELDRHLLPVRSAHSRANGRRHAITDALSWHGDIIAVSQASGEILHLGPEGAVS